MMGNNCQWLFGHAGLFMEKQIDIMKPYSDYQLSERQLAAIARNNASKEIIKFIKENGVEPTDEIIKDFYTVSQSDIEKYRRIYYAITKGEGESNVEPIIVSGDTEEESGSTIDSGSTVDSGSTEESGTTKPSSQFVLSLAEIPCAVGDGEWGRYAVSVISEKMMGGELLDYSTASITLSGDGGYVINITDLTKEYSIPNGEYVAEGWIGRTTTTNLSGAHVDYWHDWGVAYDTAWMSVSGQFSIGTDEKTIPLTLTLNDAVVVSDKEFSDWSIDADGETLYYYFTRNKCHRKGASYVAAYVDTVPRTLSFESGTYNYTVESFELGSAYCYGWNNEIPQNYSGSTPSFDYDEFVRLTYNVTDIYGPTRLFYSSASTEGIGYMEIDGQSVMPTDEYQFSTLGTHSVDVLLKDSSKMAPLRFTDVPSLRECIIPSSIDSLQNGVFYCCVGIEKITCLSEYPPKAYNGSVTSDGVTKWSDFDGINKNGHLLVPYGCRVNYDGSIIVNGLIRTNGWVLEELPNDED